MFSVNSTKELWTKPWSSDYCVRSCHCGDSWFVVNHRTAAHANETESSFKPARTPTDDTMELPSRLKTDGGTWVNTEVAALFWAPVCHGYVPLHRQINTEVHLSHILSASLMTHNQEARRRAQMIKYESFCRILSLISHHMLFNALVTGVAANKRFNKRWAFLRNGKAGLQAWQ